VENEIASHGVYSNITEQIARFGTSLISSISQIRNILLKTIENEKETKKEIENYMSQTVFKNIAELMIFLTEENDIKIVVAINEITSDLNLAFKIFRNIPDIVLLQRYFCGDTITYYYEPMLEEKTTDGGEKEFDMVVCAAFE